jgi:hypothetical protein
MMSTHLENGQGDEFPRPLTVLEHQVIRAILVDGCPGVAELRAQLGSAKVSAKWQPSGSPSIDLDISADLPTAQVADGVLPVDAHVYDEAGNYVGELLVWLSGGRLSSLEFAWVTDEMPLSLPPVNSIRISRR